jgi:hypothetical protein
MKKITLFTTSILLLFVQFLFAQKEQESLISPNQKKRIYLESGLNISLPVHIDMYRTHRLGIGINARVSKNITQRWALGIRAEYDYRFAKRNNQDTTRPSASHRNFSLICIKPNVQFTLKESRWYWGLETGLGYAISDEGSETGLGFVSEYSDGTQFGSCSGLYFGKYFMLGHQKRILGLSLNLTNFLAQGHAENTLGIKINYFFYNRL